MSAFDDYLATAPAHEQPRDESERLRMYCAWLAGMIQGNSETTDIFTRHAQPANALDVPLARDNPK